VLGPVASPPTVWLSLDEVTPAALRRVEKVRAKVRRHVWSQMSGLPASKVAGTDLGETIVLDVDATLVDAHSEKEQAAATFKHGFGFHPIGVWCDNTHELLAVMLRPGNAGSNHAGDHIEVLGRAIAQIPAQHRRHLLIRAAGATHQLLDWLAGLNQLRGRRVEYSVGFPTKNTAVSSASWRPDTAPTPGSRTGSGPLRTPVWAGSRPANGRSTPPGCNSPRSPQTLSPGCSCSPWTVTSPGLSRNCCGSGCCTWLPGLPFDLQLNGLSGSG
jgi:hypothetical protein